MPPDPPGDEPAIRPLHAVADDEVPAPSPGIGWGAWLAVAAGAVGLAVGLMLGLGIGTDPEPVPLTAVTLASLPPDLAAPGLIDPITTTTTPAPTTTTTTTTTTRPRAEPEPPPTLAEMVPGLDGTLLLAFPDDADEVWRWRLDEPYPDRFRLPTGTVEAAFDAAGGWTAALTFSSSPLRPGAGLYLAGPDLHFRQFDSGVVVFIWHPTEPGRLAWVRSTLEGAIELWTGSFPGEAEGSRRVATLGEPGVRVPLALVDWGDWGFAFAGAPRDQGGPERLVTYDPEGRLLADRELVLVAAAVDGTMLVGTGRDPGGRPVGLSLATPGPGRPTPATWAVAPPAVWSPDGARIASVLSTNLGAILQVAGESTLQSVLDTAFAFVLGWDPSNRYVVMWADGIRTRFSSSPDESLTQRERRRPALIFTDLADRSTSAIAVEHPPSAIAFRLAS